jgi:aspartate racemase
MSNETAGSASDNRAALAQRLAQLPADKRKALHTLLESKSTAVKSIPRRKPGERIPLTYGQQRLWIIEQFLAGSTPYNQTNFIRLPFEVNVEVFRRALNEIVRRHEVLRSTIVITDDIPCQQVSPSLTLEIPVIDLRRLGLGNTEAEALRLAADEAGRRFDLQTEPPIRAFLYRLDEASYLLVLIIHHIACDGWSMGVLAVELSVLYWSYVLNRPSPLPELPIQYGDFAVWQHKSINDEVLRPQLAYWRNQLSGLPMLDLPIDHPRPARFTFRGERQDIVIGGELFRSLVRLSEEHGVTMHITLLAALFVLLHRYSQQNDFAIGVPTAGRNRVELEPLVGFFVNTLVMRADLSGNPNFSEVLSRVRETSVAAYANADVPFERLVEELQPTRDPSRNPLIQVIFQLFQPPSRAGIQREHIFSFFPVPSGGSKFDLAFELVLHPEEARGFVEYNIDLFDSERIAQLVDHWKRLLENIARDRGRPIGKLDLIAQEDRHRILEDWNATKADYPRDSNVAAEFLREAGTRSDSVATEFGESRITYGELRDRAQAIASELNRRGVKKGDAVGLLLQRSLDLPAAILGIFLVGAFYVPLDPEYPAERLSYLLADSGANHVVTTAALRERHSRLANEFLVTDEITVANSVSIPEMDATQTACLLYTSGTTGRPKGVSVTHRNILRLVKNTRYVRLAPDDRVLQFAPVTFDASLFEIWGCLLNGGTLAIYPTGTPLIEDLATFIRGSGITTLFLTTALFRRVVEDSVRELRHVRQILTGGEVMPIEVMRAAWTHLPRSRILHVYGPTECVTFSTCYEITGLDALKTSVPIGRPVENTTAYIVDGDMNPVPVGIPGELLIGGDAVSTGYWQQPEATARSFIANPFAEGTVYRTGDWARYRADGNIEFLGRKDRQIKLNGYRIELEEVEAAIVSCPGVSAAALKVQTADGADAHLVAFVEPSPGSLIESGVIRKHLQTILPRFMLPSRIEVMPKLPLTATGKVDAFALSRWSPQPQGSEEEITAPRTAVEKLLSDIWKMILHLDTVTIESDFFALGGQSLIATRLLSRVRDLFQVPIRMSEFFEAPTIRGLAALVQRDRGAAERAELLVRAGAPIGLPSETARPPQVSSGARMTQ